MSVLVLAACAAPRGQELPRGDVEWLANGRDPQGTRYAPIGDITPANVSGLTEIWRFRLAESNPSNTERRFESTPLVIEGLLYLGTPTGRVVALDAASGAVRWQWEPAPAVDPRVRFGDYANRGVAYWVDSTLAADAPCRRRIIAPVIDARIAALDAATGAPCGGFGTNGVVSLRVGLRTPPYETAEYQITSPPAIVGSTIVTGSAIADNNRADAASGEVRGLDVRTGAVKWSWDPVPQDVRDRAHATWSGSVAHRSGGANAWSVIAADPARGLVFVPTSSPSPDYFGGGRVGENRYANSIVALRASTGTVVWHFQTVHHDLWDYDNASPPLLTTIRRGGDDVPVVLQATKTGMLFVLHRETGVPVVPVEERPVPASTVPGEIAARTQPFSAIVLSPHRFTASDAWGRSASDSAACRAQLAALRNEGIFTPPSLEGTLAVPSNIGGAHWGGVAVDPVRGLAVVPVNRIAAMVQLIPRDQFTPERRSEGARLGYETTDMRGTPYIMRRRLLIGPSGLPCTPPPWGTLVAIDLRTMTRRWEVPLGAMPPLGGGGEAGPAEWGSVNLGGAIVTAGGVTFVAGSVDRSLRAYDTQSGRVLWRGSLPGSGRATPATYRAAGRQYVAIAAGGGGPFGNDPALVVFALPPR